MRPGARSIRGLAAAVLCGAIICLAACGGSDDDDSTVTAEQAAEAKAIVELGDSLQRAYAGRDAAAACALVDPSDLKKQFGGKKGCVKQVNTVFGQQGPDMEIEFDEVTVDGDTATAIVKDDTGATNYDFAKVDGQWYIDLPDSAGQAS